MSITLSDQDKSTLRTAAYGAVSLVAAAGAAGGMPQKIATDGSIALASATGLIGHVLGDRSKSIKLDSKSVAALADQVLPTLTAAVTLLEKQAPAEADNFRSIVLLAIEPAQIRHGHPSPAMAEMARKITAALDAAGVATADSGAVPAAAARQDRPELQKALEEIVDDGFVGVSLRVHDARGEWVGSAGAAELGGAAKPPTNGHVRIGSNTKTFTSTLVLQLVAEGKVELDTPAADYLPEFGLDERITVRMLLQHTSGVFNFSGEVYDDGTVVLGIPMPYGPAGAEWLDNRLKTYRPQELVELALSKPARFEPGTGWSYSNTNYVLARLLIEKVTGRTYAEEMRRLILGPLGLSGTVVPDASPEIPEPHAHAYYRHEDGGEQKTIDITRQNPSWISSGGDMISTTQDLHTFLSALLGGKLLPASLLAEMCTPHPTGIPNMDYGLGVFVLTTDGGGTLISHNGAAVGHAALMYSTPDGSKTLTAALNCVDDADLSIAAAFQRAQQRLLDEVFCGGQADPAQPTD
ncbi:D-alanyl-D-alanine carboxypeptidase [Streptosporangium canum]|uniref:D-alanyl-D-alanine carboxypeptidase n=1 Tax=Streptosporangium canum TaxID=324952 RepID=A0A1I4BVY0_9ACTN|nr:serine hydrolase domain-containing protein [Streptosporangium canum]SFK72693.1 D-alanyl-D-alanine carboxypeptidase [Streptosporangium canum]